jgi:hypothetical protein
VKIRIRFTAAVLLALLLFGACLCIRYLRSDRFQELARQILISRVEKATGMNCRIDQFRLSVFRGKVSISGFSLTPKAEAPGLATLNIPEVRAAISISSFWHFRVRLADLEIIKPQVKIISGEGKGAAWSPEGVLNALKISLRLQAARVVVGDGLLTVNSRTSPFRLSLNNLDCEIRYSKETPSYKIRIEYEKSRIFYPPRDVVHDLEINADLSLQGIDIEFYRLRYRSSIFTGSGSMQNWNSPVFRIHAAGLYDVRDLTLAHASIDEGHGMMGVVADLRFDGDGVYVNGKFTVRNGKYRKMAFHDLAGKFEIKQDVLYLREVSGGVAQGNVHVDGAIQLSSANNGSNRISIISKSIPLIEVGRVLDLPLMTFENVADTTTIITWEEGDADLKVDCDANLQGIEPSAPTSGNVTPLSGNIHFVYSGTGDVYVISGNLNSSNSSVQAVGEPGGSFRVTLSTNRIAEPFRFIAQMSRPVVDLLTQEPDVLSMAGNFRFNGNVRISSSVDVEYRGDISIRNGRWRNYKLDTLTTQAEFLPPQLHLRSMMIHGGPQSASGNMDLELDADAQLTRFEFQGGIHELSMASLKDFGADMQDVSGLLSGNGAVRYNNNGWEGEGTFSVEKGSYKGESFDALNAKVHMTNRRLRVLSAEARRGAARINASGEANLETGLLDVAVRLNGFPLDEIPAVRQKRLPVRGLIGASGDFSGTMENPSFSGTIDLDALQYDNWNLGNGRGRIKFEDGVVQGNLKIQSNYGNLNAQAKVSAKPGNAGSVLLEFDNLDVQKIAGAKIPPILKEVSTALNGKVEITGRFDNPSSLDMRGEVDGAHFKVQDYELHNANRMQFTVLNQTLRMESVQFVGEGTSLVLSGNIPLEDAPQLDLNLNGSMNLKILDGIEKKLHIGGAVTLNIRASGSMRDPQVIGRASFQDARLDQADLPFRFSAMQGDIVFSRNLIRFENVRGNAASGTLQLSGILEHRNSVLRSMNMNIAIRNARLPYPKDFRSVIDADLVLNGNSDVQILTGDVNVVRAEYVRSFNLMEQLAGGSPIQSGPMTTEPYLMGLRLNVEIHSDNGLLIDNELARLRGSLRLTLRGTPAYPSLIGRVEAGEGNIFFRGSRFEISHAAADFVDRNRINPVLEIRAEADVKTYRLILDAVGDLDHLNINIASDPPMSTVDILSLLTTGKTDTATTTTTQRKSEMAGVSAASVLSENLTGVIGKRVQRIFGLESFRVDPFLAGAENDPTARITISERISKDLVVTFSRNLTTNQEQIVVIEYDVTKNLSVVATRDEDGKYGLDFRFRKRLR